MVVSRNGVSGVVWKIFAERNVCVNDGYTQKVRSAGDTFAFFGDLTLFIIQYGIIGVSSS